MSALRLATRFRRDAYEGEASLLVYDEYDFTESTLSEDVRNIFDRHPATADIYVLAPFVATDDIVRLIANGVAVARARRYFEGIGGRIRLLSIRKEPSGTLQVLSTPFEYSDEAATPGEPEVLNSKLSRGWLFDLFHRGGGLVEAPPGVHFGKLSGRHSNKFLRASAPLLTSEACAVVAFFALANTSGKAPSRILVDTAPIIAVAFAMARMAATHGLWEKQPPVKSFSSYGGVENLPRTRPTDLFLVSASTSGGLAQRLIGIKANEKRIVTLFYLESGAKEYKGIVVCNLTYKNDGLYGYASISNHEATDCPYCRAGYFLAQLEGDQFLLEKRAVKRLAVRSSSQPADARKTIERLARTGCLDVTRFRPSVWSAGTEINGERLLDTDQLLRADFVRMMRRFSPAPLHYVMLVGISDDAFAKLVEDAGLATVVAEATVTRSLEGLTSVVGGGALVVFGCLSNHAQAREINARMRTLVPGGAVAYLSAVTVAQNRQALDELEMFLSYGERGRDTFTMRSALNFMLPVLAPTDTAWEAEFSLLQRMSEEKALPAELDARLQELDTSATSKDGLFFSGERPALAIARDFVYLDTEDRRDSISQADIYAVVSNMLACVRADNQGLGAKKKSLLDSAPGTSNVYGHALVCPSNFENYNDAVLRAAFLRAASPSELLYSVDDECSTEVFNVIDAELAAWSEGGGGALPEFMLALATRRMRLTDRHLQELSARFRDKVLPQYLRDLAGVIENLPDFT
ncbi:MULTISPECIES: hypothetical protein [unclassified Caballeronia]|uniref:hypothetical protein n=1 Tax=unclassified Caballeronia TaxID=2646786 RepID=UPI002857C1D5|nr:MULTISPECIES: hypothetical protein [unclassified Caballeronia]MDR5776854.1 hypothetical protein [Caballeronia sp. LZ002]MDR5798840.1 hypothetical protein [Caballeronia sp. LZ001]MDR5852361.1 hypothetical protein [Caballeronia sp. LZ003]